MRIKIWVYGVIYRCIIAFHILINMMQMEKIQKTYMSNNNLTKWHNSHYVGLLLYAHFYSSVWPNSLGFLAHLFNPIQSSMKAQIKPTNVCTKLYNKLQMKLYIYNISARLKRRNNILLLYYVESYSMRFYSLFNS